MIEKIKCAATRHGDHIIAGANHAECLNIAFKAGFERELMVGWVRDS